MSKRPADDLLRRLQFAINAFGDNIKYEISIAHGYFMATILLRLAKCAGSIINMSTINLAICTGRGGERKRALIDISKYRLSVRRIDVRYLVLCERIPRHINNYYTHSLPLYFCTRRRIRPRWMSTTSPRMYSNPKGRDRRQTTTFSARSRISYCPSDVVERFMWLYFVSR